MSNLQIKEVPVEKLRWQCEPDSLGFKTTDELKCCQDIIGQERALKAIKLGLEVKSPGYNIFVAGLTGTGKTTTIKHILERVDSQGPVPNDICYVHNFVQPDTPKVLSLPAGQGRKLARDMDDLIHYLHQHVPKIFQSDEYKKRCTSVIEKLEIRSKSLLKKLDDKIKKSGFTLVQIQLGSLVRPEIFPVVNKEVLPWDKLTALVEKGEFKEKTFQKLRKSHKTLAAELENTLLENRKIEKQVTASLEELKYQICSPVVQELIKELQGKFSDANAVKYLDDVQTHILENLAWFQEEDTDESKSDTSSASKAEELIEFKVNVVVDNSKLKRVPVIIETAPNYQNLFGTIERTKDDGGAWKTDFTKIKAGSLLKANGGYLVLNLSDALVEPGVWAALKRTLKNRKLDIVAYSSIYPYPTSALKPEAVDIDVKVAIIGDAALYQRLYFYDPDFKKIFKVKAEFDTVMPKNGMAIGNYTAFVKKICDEEGLLPFTNSGVAEVIEYGVRLAGKQNKISTRFSDIADVLREADYWAKQNKSKVIDGDHVNQALDEKSYRSQIVEEKVQEMIDDGTILIDIEGKKIGQINGLSVYDLGDYRFGRPTKITAEVSMGRAGIINIEREADLSGKTHNKGVLIIGGYFRGKFAQDKPLSMSASLAFEQNYSGVDGDSASSTEIYAILSELSKLPLRQDIAVTGSVNQKGQIQPIGGVNQKIEGFYAVCKAKKLTGQQGVMIPHQNVQNLMLKPEIVESVKANKFHIYPVCTIDEGIEILTGVAAGKRDASGRFPKGTVNNLVDLRLKDLATGLKQFFPVEQ
ncbi:MAG: AAA family ATPase [bacterium]